MREQWIPDALLQFFSSTWELGYWPVYIQRQPVLIKGLTQCLQSRKQNCSWYTAAATQKRDFLKPLHELRFNAPELHCTVTDFCFPCHLWHNRTKEVYTKGFVWKNKSGRWLVRSRRKFWDNKMWAAGHFELHGCTTFINWVPPRGYHSLPTV